MRTQFLVSAVVSAMFVGCAAEPEPPAPEPEASAPTPDLLPATMTRREVRLLLALLLIGCRIRSVTRSNT